MRIWGWRRCILASVLTFSMLAASAQALDFSAPAVHGVFGDPFGIAVGDLNGDGHPDLVASFASSIGGVATLLGNGSGGFARATEDGVGSDAGFGVTEADLDGDGKPDLAVAAPSATSQVTVLLGKGNGTYKAGQFFSAAPSAVAIASARFTGGSLPDLVTASDSLNEISLLKNATLSPGSVTFSAPTQFAFGYSAQALAVADFNGDHVPDLAVADFSENGKPSGFTILDGTGNATGFSSSTFTALGTDVFSVVAGDVNGDGFPDLAFLDADERVEVLLNDGHGGFGAPTTYDQATGLGQPFPHAIAFGDVERNGRPDLLIQEVNRGSGDLLVMHNNGHGAFTAAGRYPTAAIGDVMKVADLNADGAPDIILGDSTGTLAILFNIGQTQPSPASVTFPALVTGRQSRPKSISIRNTGAAPMTIEGLALAGAGRGSFGVVDRSCTGLRLGPGASCTAAVVFKPLTLGPSQAALRVFTDTGSGPTDIALSGAGSLGLSLKVVGHPRLGTRSIRVKATCSSACRAHLTLRRHGKALASRTAAISSSKTLTLRLKHKLAARRTIKLKVAGRATAGSAVATATVHVKLTR